MSRAFPEAFAIRMEINYVDQDCNSLCRHGHRGDCRAHVRQCAYLDVEIAPPESRVEVIPSARAGYAWAPGYYNYSGHQHVWVGGRCIHERHGHHWTADRWEQHGTRWHHEAGRWDHD